MTPLESEMNQMCGEVWNQMEMEEEYRREDPMGCAKAVCWAFLFSVITLVVILGAGVVARAFQP